MQRKIDLVISINHSDQRLDQAVANLLPEFSRSYIQKWIKAGSIVVNDQKTTIRQKVFLGDRVTGHVQEVLMEKEYQPQNIAINVLYQDEDVIVINKSAGLVVHPGAGNADKTLLNALIYHFPELKQVPRAGIVHRLDKDTSGVMVVARNLQAQYHLVKQLQNRSVKRHYLALVTGNLISGGTVNAAIGRAANNRLRMAVTLGGKVAITHYQIQQKYEGFTLLACQLETGRTHQIRVHLAHIRHPLVGDPLYGNKSKIPKGLAPDTRAVIQTFPRQALHALRLAFIHPKSNKNIRFETDLPEDIQSLIMAIEDKKRAS